MRAHFIFEKFTQDSDPIKDMGIGLESKLKDWINNLPYHWKPNIKDTEEVLHSLISTNGPDLLIDYLLKERNDYRKNDTISYFISRGKERYLKFIDYLITEKRASISDLLDKITYINLGGTLAPLTPEDHLIIASRQGNFSDFKKLVESGVKVKIGMINSLFKHEWSWQTGAKRQYDKILNYLRYRVDDLEELVHPRDRSKLDKIKKYLSIKKENRKDYPTGYKIYRILKYIDEVHPESKKDISKFTYELTYGKDTFNPLTDLSYWTDGFDALVQPRITIKSGKMYLNNKGKEKLEKAEAKFGPMKIKAHL
jgi:hypothetical protein